MAAAPGTAKALFRSEEMTYMQSILPAEAARAFVHQMATMQCAQFTDVRLDLFL